jgi:hypothetical protein
MGVRPCFTLIVSRIDIRPVKFHEDPARDLASFQWHLWLQVPADVPQPRLVGKPNLPTTFTRGWHAVLSDPLP